MWQSYFTPPVDEHADAVRRDDAPGRTLHDRRAKAPRRSSGRTARSTTERWHRRSDDGKTDAYFWLAPSLHYIPVKMRVTATDRGTVEVCSTRSASTSTRTARRNDRCARTSSRCSPPRSSASRAARHARPTRRCSAFFRAHPAMGQRDRALDRRRRVRVSAPHALARSARGDARSRATRARRRRARAAAARLRDLEAGVQRGRRRVAARVQVAPRRAAAAGGRRRPARLAVGSGSATPTATTERAALARAWHAPAPFDLRVNPLKSDARRRARGARRRRLRRRADALLAARHSRARPARRSRGIRGSPTAALEVQDEGSQLDRLPRRAAAQRHGRRFLRRRGRQDAAARRADALAGTPLRVRRRRRSASPTSTPRLARSGLSNVHPQVIANERDTEVKRLAGKIDRVLVDAPCTGFGTLRRNPDLKWRQQPRRRRRARRQAGAHPRRARRRW